MIMFNKEAFTVGAKVKDEVVVVSEVHLETAKFTFYIEAASRIGRSGSKTHQYTCNLAGSLERR